jgi:hypothetical protein
MLKTHLKYLLFGLIFFSKISTAQVFINELMASNNKSVTDNQGKNPDWIEIYNPGFVAFNLNGHYLSDDPLNPLKFQLKSNSDKLIIPSRGFLIIWCSGEPQRGDNHLSFSLSSESESIILTSADGKKTIDRIDFENQRTDVSYGRKPDGSSVFKYFKNPTPTTSNSNAISFLGITKAPIFNIEGGYFTQNQKLKISSNEPDVKIYYSVDGSTPGSEYITPQKYFYKNQYVEAIGQTDGAILTDTYNSYLYQSEIEIKDPAIKSNDLSMKSSSWHQIPYYLPNYNIPKATVVKAIAERDGYLPSDVTAHTYIFNKQAITSDDFFLISIQTNENSLFDYEKGIYNAGINYDKFKSNIGFEVADFCSPGNYSLTGGDAEALGSFEVFDKNKRLFSQNISYKIHGACSRSVPAKSLRIYGKNNFDSFSFFKDKPEIFHNNIILRNGGNDFNGTMIRDAFNHKLLSQFNIGKQLSQPSILYLNGEYWGIHNIRERLDNDYLEKTFGVDKRNIDMYKVVWYGDNEIEYGDDKHINFTLNFLENNDLGNSDNYKQATKLIDPSNLIDYQIGEIFIGNVDWPQNNVRIWRNRTSEYAPFAPYGHDGRWRFLLFDTDKSLGMIVNADHNSILQALESPENIIFRRFLHNNEFKNDFINRFSDAINSNFRKEYSTKLFESLRKTYDPEIDKHLARWKNIESKSKWEDECNVVNSFLKDRPESIIKYLKLHFDLKERYKIKIINKNRDQGLVKINSLLLSENTQGIAFENNVSWKGSYFEDILISIEAIPAAGHSFLYWIHKGQQIKEKKLIINLNEDKDYEAVFEQNNKPNQLNIPAASLADCGFTLVGWSPFSAKSSHPNNSKFVFMNKKEPEKSASIAGFTEGFFNNNSKTRITGLDSLGISFTNTSSESPNEGYPDGQLGGFLIAVNTLGLDSAQISWRGRTIINGTRKYSIALQIREGDSGTFKDLGPEYKGENGSNRTKTIDKVIIPIEYINKPYVQLLWRYYFNGQGSSGSRDELAIDDIKFDAKVNTLVLNQGIGYNYNDLLNTINSSNLRISENNSYSITNNALNNSKPKSPVIISEKMEVCGSEKIKISAIGCVNGTIFWSNGSKSRNIEVSEGSYSALCQSSCGESDYSEKIEIKRIAKIPTPEIFSDENFICPQGNNTIRVNKCDGVVVWSNGSTGPILPLKSEQAGIYSAYCSANGCKSDQTQSINISLGKPSKPIINSIKKDYCLGESAFLLASGCSGIYEWESQTGKQELLKFTGDKAGTYSLRARCISLSGECISDWSEPYKINFIQSPLPPITIVEISNICNNNTVNLEDAVIGTSNESQIYFFSHNSPNSQRVINHKMVEKGRYFAFYRNSTGCYSQGSVIDVNIKPCGSFDIRTEPIDLSINISGPKSQVPKNSIFEAKIDITNKGKARATDVQFGLIVPPDLDFKGGENVIFENGKVLSYRSNVNPGENTSSTIKFEKKNESESILKAEVFFVNQLDIDETNNFSYVAINSQDEIQKLGLNLVVEEAEPMGDDIFEINALLYLNNLSFKPIRPIQIEFETWKLNNKDYNIIENPKITSDQDLLLNPFYSGTDQNINILIDSMSFITSKETRKLKITFKVKRNKSAIFPLKLRFKSKYGENQTEYSNEGLFSDPDFDGDPSNNSEPAQVLFSKLTAALACSQTVVDSIKLNENEHAVTFLIKLKNNKKASQ